MHNDACIDTSNDACIDTAPSSQMDLAGPKAKARTNARACALVEENG
jgi:hypothetical protein